MKQAVIAAALKLLERSDYFEAQIMARLSPEYAEAEVSEAIEFLKSRRLLDDRRLAARLAEHLSQRRLYGPERIRQELHRRGAPAEVIEESLATLPPEEEVALSLACKIGKADPARLARRLVAAGFSSDVVESVTATVIRHTP